MKDANSIKVRVIKNDSEKEKNIKHFNKGEQERDKVEKYLSQKSDDQSYPVFIPTESQYRPTGLIKALDWFSKALVIFLLGGLGGVWLEHRVIPRLAGKEPFSRYSFFKSLRDRTMIINRIEEVKISEDSAAAKAIRKTIPSTVKITANYIFQEKNPRRGSTPAPKIESRNLNGTIVTADGFILTRDPKIFTTDQSRYSLKEINYIVNYNNKEFSVSGKNDISFFDSAGGLKANDPRNNIVLLKIKANNLPVAALAAAGGAEIGEKAIALGNNIFSGIVSEIKKEPSLGAESDDLNLISIDNAPPQNYFGSGPLISLEGEVLGINVIDNKGNPTINFIASEDLKKFIDKTISEYNK